MNTPINSQGTKAYVVDVPATEWADCSEAIAAILAGKEVLCPQSIGSLEETRTVQEIKCLSSNESTKVAGSVSRGTVDLGMLFDPTDVDGQEAFKAAFTANTPFRVGIEYSDRDISVGEVGVSGTIDWFDGIVSTQSKTIEMDTAVMYSATVEIASEITTCPAVAGSA